MVLARMHSHHTTGSMVSLGYASLSFFKTAPWTWCVHHNQRQDSTTTTTTTHTQMSALTKHISATGRELVDGTAILLCLSVPNIPQQRPFAVEPNDSQDCAYQ